jgi:hypothetical protein
LAFFAAGFAARFAGFAEALARLGFGAVFFAARAPLRLFADAFAGFLAGLLDFFEGMTFSASLRENARLYRRPSLCTGQGNVTGAGALQPGWRCSTMTVV